MKTITTTFDYLEEQGYPSVTDYCRFLMELNPERYEDMPVEVYRGERLCLIVKSVKEGAKIQPSSSGFVSYNPFPSKRPDKAPEMAQD